jgi:uncharacterized membrane protein
MHQPLAASWSQHWSPRKRRVIQALTFESIAVAMVAPVMMFFFGEPPLSSFLLTVTMSAIAAAWNFGFNAAFEAWEVRQTIKGRNWKRRVVHGIGFELGLSVMLVPLMAVWLGLSLWEALLADAGLIAFFLVYAMVFTWCFDRVFGLPLSARDSGAATTMG